MIKELIDQGFCFAVLQSYSYLTKKKLLENQQYELIGSKRDYKDLKKFGFVRNISFQIPVSHQNPEEIVSQILDTEEIKEFRSIREEYFTKVTETKDGTVWEISGKSFKQYLKKHGIHS